MKSPKFVARYSSQSTLTALVTLVVPVFNQETRICEVIDGLAANLSTPARIILIDDGSEDESLKAIISASFGAVHKYKNKHLEFEIYRYQTSVFETQCDRFGLSLVKTRYAIEVQADMVLLDESFDSRLIHAMQTNEDVLFVSGRGVEKLGPVLERYWTTLGADVASVANFRTYVFKRVMSLLFANLVKKTGNMNAAGRTLTPPEEIFPSSEEFEKTGQAGQLGHLVDSPLPENFDKSKLWVGETVMRGPLAIDMDKYRKLGGFDHTRFFLGYDEHSLVALGANMGYRVGYCPVRFSAPLSVGSTRSKRSLKSEFLIALNLLRISKTRAGTVFTQPESILATLQKPQVREI